MKVKGEIGIDVFKVTNNILIPMDELEKATKTLIGKPVTLNFGKYVIGKVVDAYFQDGKIHYVANIKKKLKKKLRAAISYDKKDNDMVYGISFTELSNVTEEWEYGIK